MDEKRENQPYGRDSVQQTGEEVEGRRSQSGIRSDEESLFPRLRTAEGQMVEPQIL